MVVTAVTPDAVAAAVGDTVRVEDLRRMSGGASRETWSFDAIRSDGTRDPLVLRRDAGPSVGIGMAAESAVLRAAAGAGVPVPRIVAEGMLGGLGFVAMNRVQGETIPRKILRDDEFAGARQVLPSQCGEALARIHSIRPADVPVLTAHDPWAWCRGILDNWAHPQPALEIGMRALDRTRPVTSQPTTVVHGDFRTGNLIVGDDGLRAVLDWELAHLGDPLEDLGWLCVKSWRFRSPRRAGGFGDVDDVVVAYERAGGMPVDRDALAWWELMGTLRWGAICILQVNAHLTGQVRSVEQAAIGRRICEVEHDVLLLVEEMKR